MSAELKVISFFKVCSICKVEKPRDAFVNNAGKNQLGITSDCKNCRNTIRKERRAEIRAKSVAKREAEEALLPPVTERTCLKCNEVKSLEDFAVDRSGTYGRKSRCKPCCNQAYVDPRGKRPGRFRKYFSSYLEREYGITFEQAKEALDSQLGLCANTACGQELTFDAKHGAPNRACVDHSHKTGEFRAILCYQCNTQLGRIENPSNKVLGLVSYAEKHGVKLFEQYENRLVRSVSKTKNLDTGEIN
jgi:hypothetical protein